MIFSVFRETVPPANEVDVFSRKRNAEIVAPVSSSYLSIFVHLGQPVDRQRLLFVNSNNGDFEKKCEGKSP